MIKELLKVVVEFVPPIGPRTRRAAKAAAVSFALLATVYIPFIHYLEPHQVGIGWNWVTGEVRLTSNKALNFSPPWMMVSRIDTRPKRVCVTSTTRAINCKLVQFEPKAFREFAATEGFRYYWWSNRLSFNMGYDDEYRGMKDVLRGYAYSVKKYPFVTVLREYEE